MMRPTIASPNPNPSSLGAIDCASHSRNFVSPSPPANVTIVANQTSTFHAWACPITSFHETTLKPTINSTTSIALIAGSTQLSTMAAFMNSSEVGLRVSLGLALIALIIVAIAENGRIPVDNPATHLELTMVHEAMVLEYSGRHLALIELSAALKLLLYISLIACLFAPWGLSSPAAGPWELTVGAVAYVAKLAAGGALLAVFETVIAKMRVFRLPGFIGAALMLALLATLLRFVSGSF